MAVDKNAYRCADFGRMVPWRDQPPIQCPLCEAAFRASSRPLLERILDQHVAKTHGLAADEVLSIVDPRPDAPRTG